VDPCLPSGKLNHLKNMRCLISVDDYGLYCPPLYLFLYVASYWQSMQLNSCQTP